MRRRRRRRRRNKRSAITMMMKTSGPCRAFKFGEPVGPGLDGLRASPAASAD